MDNPKDKIEKSDKSGAGKPISLHDVGFEQALKDLLTTEPNKDKPKQKEKKN